MIEQLSRPADQGVGSLLHELVDGSLLLLRQEWALAKLEILALGKEIGKGAAQVAIGGVLFALGGLAVLASAALALGDPWVNEHQLLVIGLGVLLLITLIAWLAKSGIKALVETDLTGDHPTEVKEWPKHRRTFAATSK